MHQQGELVEIFLFSGRTWDNGKQGLEIKCLKPSDPVPPCHLRGGGQTLQPPGWKALCHWGNLASAFCLLAFVYLFFSYHGEWRPSGYEAWWRTTVTLVIYSACTPCSDVEALRAVITGYSSHTRGPPLVARAPCCGLLLGIKSGEGG